MTNTKQNNKRQNTWKKYKIRNSKKSQECDGATIKMAWLFFSCSLVVTAQIWIQVIAVVWIPFEQRCGAALASAHANALYTHTYTLPYILLHDPAPPPCVSSGRTLRKGVFALGHSTHNPVCTPLPPQACTQPPLLYSPRVLMRRTESQVSGATVGGLYIFFYGSL